MLSLKKIGMQGWSVRHWHLLKKDTTICECACPTCLDYTTHTDYPDLKQEKIWKRKVIPSVERYLKHLIITKTTGLEVSMLGYNPIVKSRTNASWKIPTQMALEYFSVFMRFAYQNLLLKFVDYLPTMN